VVVLQSFFVSDVVVFAEMQPALQHVVQTAEDGYSGCELFESNGRKQRGKRAIVQSS
jgi:hypothetical protein